jgi:hydrogenase maturation protein HypF
MARFRMCAAARPSTTTRRPPLPRAAQRLPGLRPALSAPIEEARRGWRGEILAIKGLGGFHLACDARNAAAAERLRAASAAATNRSR